MPLKQKNPGIDSLKMVRGAVSLCPHHSSPKAWCQERPPQPWLLSQGRLRACEWVPRFPSWAGCYPRDPLLSHFTQIIEGICNLECWEKLRVQQPGLGTQQRDTTNCFMVLPTNWFTDSCQKVPPREMMDASHAAPPNAPPHAPPTPNCPPPRVAIFCGQWEQVLADD